MNQEQLLFIIIPLLIWDLSWKGAALWRAARNGQIKWFVPILIFNTLGILPIVYIQFFQKNKIND